MSYFEENGFLDCMFDDAMERPYVAQRFTGTQLVDGRLEKVVDGSFVGEIIGHIEDASPRKLERLTDHENEQAKIAIVTKYELKIMDRENGIPADVITFRGRNFEVKEISQANAITGHRKALAILVTP